MADATTTGPMSTGRLKVAERARRDPQARILALARLLDEELLTEAFDRIRKEAAVGVDGITKEQYAEHLEDNLRALHERLKAGRYRHQPIRRVHIPKAPGKTRPIGISTIEDKVVQNALHRVLEAIYEQDFLDCSYGFRPGRGAHDALRAMDAAVMRGQTSWVLEADIRSFFDSLDRTKLMEMLRQRVADESLLRLVGKCLHVGVLDGEEYSEPHEGTTQGSTLSPILGNIYLHQVLDLWFEREVRPRLRGGARLIRYADDFIILFERREDAERVLAVLPKRMARFNLTLHPEKTRLLPFDHPPCGQVEGKGPATFDFLGFTVYWRRTRQGTWVPGLKTRRARLQRATQAIADFCRRHRHEPVKEQHAALGRRLRGHYQYFGVNGNLIGIRKVAHAAARSWYKWLRRRSQRTRLTWERFNELLAALPFPRTRIYVRIWGVAP
ncbi:MAG: group II intron reverse transcriptase/maturase [Myxococcota bacterium]|nr:group II intron reverse transcriptase/maturase [Myxococcota bacterium]